MYWTESLFCYIIYLKKREVTIIWKRIFLGIDYGLLATVLILFFFGLIMIQSTTSHHFTAGPNLFLARQISAAIMGFTIMLAILYVDYRRLKNYSEVIYIGNIIVLILILFFGRTISGGQRWFYLGPINFQPSEIAKLGIIISLAAILSDKEIRLKRLKDFLYPFFYVGLPVLLIFVQNDLGTSLVFVVILVGMLFLAGANSRILFGLVGSVFVAMTSWIFLHLQFGIPIPFKRYQLMRLLVFLDPALDPFQYGYNIIQSKIAIGSGELYGKGLFLGTQNRLSFLPEQHTDFVFSVVGEELGFVGSIIILGLFFILLYKGIRIIGSAEDRFGVLIAGGIIFMLSFHILENIGMVMGLLPITGLPLPFVSYGGSSLLTNFAAIGLLLNINMRRKNYF